MKENKYSWLLAIATLGSMSMTSQAADWTPLFKSLETNCQFTLRESNKVKVPKSFVKDIVSKKENDQGDSYDLTMKLKNATAFGSPLTKMVVKSNTVVFKKLCHSHKLSNKTGMTPCKTLTLMKL